MTNLESLVRRLIEDGNLYADESCSCERCLTIIKIKAALDGPAEGVPRALAHEPDSKAG